MDTQLILGCRGRGRGCVAPVDPADLCLLASQLGIELPILNDSSSSCGEEVSISLDADASPLSLSIDDAPSPLSNVTDELNEEKLAVRSGFGCKGRKVRLYTNWYQVRFPEELNICRYSVSVTEKRADMAEPRPMVVKKDRMQKEEDRTKCFEIFQAVFDEHSDLFDGNDLYTLAYDRHKILITLNPLNLGENSSCCLYHNTKDSDGVNVRYAFKIQFVEEINVGQLARKAQQLDPGDVKRCPSADKMQLNEDVSWRQILDILFSQWFYINAYWNKSNFLPVGRSFFKPNEQNVDLGDGRTMYIGISKQHRQIFGDGQQPSLFAINVDVAHTAFYREQTLLQFAASCLKVDVLPKMFTKDMRFNLLRKLKGVFVELIQNRFDCRSCRFQVDGLGKDAAVVQQMLANGKTCNVAEHVLAKYGLKLSYPTWPCVQVKVGKSITFYPMELLRIAANQKVARGHCKDEALTSEIIKHAAMPPEIRQKRIQEMLREVRLDLDCYANAFRIERSDAMMELTGRVIDEPKVEYKDGKILQPDKGVWDAGDQKFLIPGLCDQWAFICLNIRMDVEVAKNFAYALVDVANRKGLKMPPDPCFHFFATRNASYTVEGIMKDMIMHYRTAAAFLCIVILDADVDSTEIHDEVKCYSERCFDFVTQCVKPKTARIVGFNYDSKRGLFNSVKEGFKARTTTLNIVNKMNSKLGGINCKLADDIITKTFMHRRVMIVGADVTHPPPHGRSDREKGPFPSISVLTAPRNTECQDQYFAAARVQYSRMEYLVFMKEQIKQLVMGCFEKNRFLPDTILFYRDGVADGMYSEVLSKEVPQIRKACQEIGVEFNCAEFEPKLLYIIVTKRHHTRFFKADLKNPRAVKNAEKNVEAGTVVDTGPVHPVNYEFYLCSHAGIQGCSKPTKYVVLVDDLSIGADDLQQLTYHLCHGMARCTRAISIPVPVYHAHLACEHFKKLWSAESARTESSSGVSSDSDLTSSSLEKHVDYAGFQEKIAISEFCLSACPWA